MNALTKLLSAGAALGLTLATLLAVTFGLARSSPIDPVLQRLGDHASSEAYQQARHELGLDRPWPEQLASYANGVLHGDFGISRATGSPVSEDLRRVVPATVELATLALVLGTLIALGLSLLSARHPFGAVDAVARLASVVGSSLPVFWTGLLALLLFYATLHWTSGTGRLSDAYEYTIGSPTGLVLLDAARSGAPGALRDALAHLLLPVLVLSTYAVAGITRLARAALLEEAGREYVTLARAKGCGEWRILLGHVLPNAAGTIITVVALTYANLLQGAVLVETVFARPGLGRYLTTAVFAVDLPAILGATLVIGAAFILINAAADVLARLIDPRRA